MGLPRPNMFERILSSRVLDLRAKLSRSNSSSPSLILSDRQTDILNDCVTQVKSDIFKTEAQIITLLSNILTITRCVKLILPASFEYGSFRFLDHEFDESLDLRTEIDKLGKSCADELQERHNTRTKIGFQPSKLGPVSWRPQQIPESERFIAPPTTFKSSNCHKTRQSELEMRLGMLILKKAEMCVQVENLEDDLEFWADLYEDVKCQKKKSDLETAVCMRNTKRMSLPLTNFDTTSVARPSMTRAHSINFVPTIPRKEVPIREMLKRIQKNAVDEEERRDEKRHDSGVSIDDPVAVAARVPLPGGGLEMLKQDSAIGGINDEKACC